MSNNWMIRFAHIIPALMLVLAPFASSAGYFDILRWAVCGGCGYLAFSYKDTEIEEGWFWGMVILALLFNPIVPFHNDRATWALIDIGSAAFIYIAWRRVKRIVDEPHKAA